MLIFTETTKAIEILEKKLFTIPYIQHLYGAKKNKVPRTVANDIIYIYIYLFN